MKIDFSGILTSKLILYTEKEINGNLLYLNALKIAIFTALKI